MNSQTFVRTTPTMLLAFFLSAAMASVCAAATPRIASSSTTAPRAELRVDINRASLEDLLKVPGMTRTWAARIVRFRPYRSKQDLLDRGVLPGDVYRRVKDYVIAHRAKQ